MNAKVTHQHCLKLLISLSCLSLLSGCMSPGKNILPQQGVSMSDIYYQQTHGRYAPNKNNKIPRKGQASLSRSNTLPKQTQRTRQKSHGLTQARALAKVHKLFKQLPNPEIALYVYPHLVKEGGDYQPVPDYTTSFFLYEHPQYALPSEVY